MRRDSNGFMPVPRATRIVAVGFVAALLAGAAPAQSARSAKSATPPASAASVAAHTRYHPDRFAGRAGTYYRVVWGVDTLGVKAVESGQVIRFTYRVVDADKAKALGDKRAEPALVDPQAGVQLVVPSVEQIGQLRQGGAVEAGKSLWMAFSNKGRMVKRGDRVSVVIGDFRADGLVVD